MLELKVMYDYLLTLPVPDSIERKIEFLSHQVVIEERLKGNEDLKYTIQLVGNHLDYFTKFNLIGEKSYPLQFGKKRKVHFTEQYGAQYQRKLTNTFLSFLDGFLSEKNTLERFEILNEKFGFFTGYGIYSEIDFPDGVLKEVVELLTELRQEKGLAVEDLFVETDFDKLFIFSKYKDKDHYQYAATFENTSGLLQFIQIAAGKPIKTVEQIRIEV